MKYLLALLLLMTAVPGSAQEFALQANGLIYADSTMTRLRQIVDSLHIRYRTCDASRRFLSVPQGRGHYVSVEKRRVREALADLQAGMSFASFTAKYRGSAAGKNLLLLLNEEEDEGKRSWSITSYGGSEATHESSIGVPLKQVSAGLRAGQWIIEYDLKPEYSDPYVNAIFLAEPPVPRALPASYARLVQYADCLVDTTEDLMRPGATRSYRFEEDCEGACSFVNYLDACAGPVPKDAGWGARDSMRALAAERLSQTDPVFAPLLRQAIDDAQRLHASNDELEFFVAKYHSAAAALELKRQRIVVGICSRDGAPRRHAQAIARLSAEAVNWTAFLRAHLNIMNDRFERMSDASYAWGGRATYLPELEALDINAVDLLLGTTVRIGNPAPNHYFSSVGRTGRAFSESRDSLGVGARLLAIVGDPQLDDYNRMVFAYLFLNYNACLKDPAHRGRNRAALTKLLRAWPGNPVPAAHLREGNEE